MWRKSERREIPQRSRLIANKELRQAIHSDRPRPFGIRRRVAHSSARPLLHIFQGLLDEGEIPSIIDPRDSLHVTALPLRKLSSQLSRGLVIGYEFGKAKTRIERGLKDDYADRIEVQLGHAAIIGGHTVALRVESEQLDEEHETILRTMGELGLHGAFKDIPPPHLSLGNSKPTLTRFEQKRTREVLDEIMSAEGPAVVVLEPLEFYPVNHTIS